MLTKQDLIDISNIVKTEIKQELRPVRSDLKKIKQDQKFIINFFDKAYLELKQRVEKIEHTVFS